MHRQFHKDYGPVVKVNADGNSTATPFVPVTPPDGIVTVYCVKDRKTPGVTMNVTSGPRAAYVPAIGGSKIIVLLLKELWLIFWLKNISIVIPVLTFIAPLTGIVESIRGESAISCNNDELSLWCSTQENRIPETTINATADRVE